MDLPFRGERRGTLARPLDARHRCSKQTLPDVEYQVFGARALANYGRERLAPYLERQGTSCCPPRPAPVWYHRMATTPSHICLARPLVYAITAMVTFETDWAKSWVAIVPSRSVPWRPASCAVCMAPRVVTSKVASNPTSLVSRETTGCVERTHRTDAEEPYRPCLPQAASDGDFLGLAARAAIRRMCSGLASEMEWGKGLVFEP